MNTSKLWRIRFANDYVSIVTADTQPEAERKAIKEFSYDEYCSSSNPTIVEVEYTHYNWQTVFLMSGFR